MTISELIEIVKEQLTRERGMREAEKKFIEAIMG